MQIRFSILLIILIFAVNSAFAGHLPATAKGCSGDVSFDLETAVTDDEQLTGLMNRTSLKENGGMIFIFPRPVRIKMWMKNTLIPLDMLFINLDKKIIYIEKNTIPMTQTLIGPDDDFSYVIELNAGTADKNCINVGDSLKF